MGACVALYGLLGGSEGHEGMRKGRGTDVEPQPSRTQECSSSLLLNFWLVSRALLLVRRDATSGDLLLLFLYGA